MGNDDILRKLVYTAKELKILKSISQIANTTDNIDVIINKIIRVILREFDIGMVFFILKEEGEIKIKNLDESRPLHPAFQELISIIGEDTINDASPILVKESKPGTRLRHFGITSFASVPLMIYTGAIGAIILMARNRSFTSTTLRLLSAIANQTASSIEHIWLKRKVSEKEKKITKLYSKLYDKEARKAIMDALTGLFNRRYFVELMDSESKKGKQLCLIMLDIDFFKSYNDTFGHVEGDHLLRNIGQLIQTKLKNVKACRYGGEEFAFILETNIEEAIKTAELFRRAVETLYPEKAKRQVTVSLGVGQRKKGENVETFTKRVDSALYKAKESGRNQVQIAK